MITKLTKKRKKKSVNSKVKLQLLEKFLKEYTDTTNPDSSIPKWEFEKELNSWLIQNRYRKMSDKTIVKKMREKGVTDGRVYVDWWINDNTTTKQIRAWIGIKWQQDSKDSKDR